ncbi:nicotinate mononucleotide-dependent phosphoribosyltransferase CobT [Methanogenium cariaci]
MSIISEKPEITFSRPMMGVVIGNTRVSTVPGISAAGPTPELTLATSALDGEILINGKITSAPVVPVSPTGCATPATLTRAMAELCELQPFVVNAGLAWTPTYPAIDVYGACGGDPREGDAVPDAEALYLRGKTLGSFLGEQSDFLLLGESVPGGTTTALCVLRALGYTASVSSSHVEHPATVKEEICAAVMQRIEEENITDPLAIVRAAGDPMMPVCAGIAATYPGTLVYAGGTQMLAVAALVKALGGTPPHLATTVYVRDDANATFVQTAAEIGATASFVDPDFGNIGHPGLARYCAGEVKEGAGAGGALWLASMMGHPKVAIWEKIREFMKDYS